MTSFFILIKNSPQDLGLLIKNLVRQDFCRIFKLKYKP